MLVALQDVIAGTVASTSFRWVMVLEDDARLLRALYEHLELLGFVVVAVADGQTALNALSVVGVDRLALALLDRLVPGRLGSEVARELRSRYDFSGPIVMLTGEMGVSEEDMEGLAVRVVSKGAIDVAEICRSAGVALPNAHARD